MFHVQCEVKCHVVYTLDLSPLSLPPNSLPLQPLNEPQIRFGAVVVCSGSCFQNICYGFVCLRVCESVHVCLNTMKHSAAFWFESKVLCSAAKGQQLST
jgi:hypothetical protein